MKITIEKLPSGYYHIRGEGPCNWAQVENLPCSKDDLMAGNFQGGDEFINHALEVISVLYGAYKHQDKT